MGMYAGLSQGMALREANESTQLNQENQVLQNEALRTAAAKDAASQQKLNQAAYLNELADGHEALFNPPENMDQVYPQFAKEFRGKYKGITPNADGSLTLIANDGSQKIVTQNDVINKAETLRRHARAILHPEGSPYDQARAMTPKDLADIAFRKNEQERQNREVALKEKMSPYDIQAKQADISKSKAEADWYKNRVAPYSATDKALSINELSNYVDISPFSDTNPKGLKPTDKAAFLEGVAKGAKPSEVLAALGVKTKAQKTLEAAENAVKNAGWWQRTGTLLKERDAAKEALRSELEQLDAAFAARGKKVKGQGLPMSTPEESAEEQERPVWTETEFITRYANAHNGVKPSKLHIQEARTQGYVR